MNNQIQSNDIWVLLDERAGNRSQTLGVAKALDLNFKKIIYEYNNLSKFPNWILKSSILHVKSIYKQQFKPPWPKIVIGCGRRAAPIGLWIKEKSKDKSSYIQILWPGRPYKKIDLIAIPEHDKIIPKINTINFTTAPHTFEKESLFKAKKEWFDTLDILPYPRIAVSIGGDTKNSKFLPNDSKIMMKLLINLIKTNGSLMITTSRRTSKESSKVIKNEISILGNRAILWEMNSNSKYKNPYPGFLSYADAVAVTGDSISLCSEACSTGKPVLIFAPKSITSDKKKYFHQSLINKGIATYLKDTNYSILDKISYKPINEANYIASEIKKRFLN